METITSYSIHSDQELTALLKAGDELAFTEIYNRYKFILHAHAVNKLRDREEAKDIIQEVFTYLWSKRDVVELKSNLSGYLYGAVRHAILNRISRRDVQDKYLDNMKVFSNSGNIQTDHLVRERQLREFIELEIASLPEKMRLVFELSRVENLSHKEIAARLGISEQTVSKQITNALKILKTRLGILVYFWLLMNS